MRHDGTGRGTAVGAPLEAVVQDLCDTRNDLKKVASAVKEMRAASDASKEVLLKMAETMCDIRGLMKQLRDITQSGITESQLMWGKMDDMLSALDDSRDALKENTNVRS
jgi:hypothetical protein